MIVWEPTLKDDTEPTAVLPDTIPSATPEPPSLKMTKPAGPFEVVAVNVTEEPYADGVPEEATDNIGVALRTLIKNGFAAPSR